jgi:hypothetical protein
MVCSPAELHLVRAARCWVAWNERVERIATPVLMRDIDPEPPERKRDVLRTAAAVARDEEQTLVRDAHRLATSR